MKGMIVIPVLMLLYFADIVFAQQDSLSCTFTAAELDIGDDGIFLYKGKPANGMACSFSDSGKLQEEVPYKNGKMEGIAKEYYESGKLWIEAPYKNGKEEGIAKTYYESGRLKSEITYKDDKREGAMRRYVENGRLWGTILYKNGEAVSGTCGDGRPFTNAELLNWENGYDVSCDY